MPGYEKETMEWKTSQGGKRAEKGTKRNGTSKANGEVRMGGRVEGEEGSRINLFARKLGVAASLVKNGEGAGGACGDETSK